MSAHLSSLHSEVLASSFGASFVCAAPPAGAAAKKHAAFSEEEIQTVEKTRSPLRRGKQPTLGLFFVVLFFALFAQLVKGVPLSVREVVVERLQL